MLTAQDRRRILLPTIQTANLKQYLCIAVLFLSALAVMIKLGVLYTNQVELNLSTGQVREVEIRLGITVRTKLKNGQFFLFLKEFSESNESDWVIARTTVPWTNSTVETEFSKFEFIAETLNNFLVHYQRPEKDFRQCAKLYLECLEERDIDHFESSATALILEWRKLERE